VAAYGKLVVHFYNTATANLTQLDYYYKQGCKKKHAVRKT